MTIHLNIGSNRGHRRTLIERAVAALRSAIPGTLRRSDFIETEPWGFESPNRFLNLGVAIEPDTPIDPLDILAITASVERSISHIPHRDATGGYADREIDIDIIAVDRVIVNNPRLILPHPRAAERDFVIIPLRSLDPSTAEWLLQEHISASQNHPRHD